MQIEQSADLNKHVDPSIPLTWAVRWQALRPGLPLLVCCSVLFVEQLLFRSWLNDRNIISELPLVFVCALAPIVLVMAAFEMRVRVAHRTKRTIQLEPKRVSISPAKYNRIAWKQVIAWRLEPLADTAGLSKLSVEYFRGKKGGFRREWSMVLRQPDQEHALLSELDHFRQLGTNAAQVVQLSEPRRPKASCWRMGSIMALALSLWLFVHGVPMLVVGLFQPTGHRDETESTSRFTPKERAKIQKTVTRFFSSPHQLRVFFLVVGGQITVLGAGSYCWAIFTLKKANSLASGSESSPDAPSSLRNRSPR